MLSELRRTNHFEQAAQLVDEEDLARSVICGPDSEQHLQGIRDFAAAGFGHLRVHQIGPDQEGFFRFYQHEILPQFH